MRELLAGIDPFDVLDAEAFRLDRYFGALSADEWLRPSRCAGWTVRDVLSHLAGEESYNHACLDDDLDRFFESLKAADVDGAGGFNEWCVRQRRDLPVDEVLTEWREANARTRREMRALGADTRLPTMAGPYPVWLQAFHYASELATHADDVGATADPAEEPNRTHWRARLARMVLVEQRSPAHVDEMEGRIRVGLDGGTTLLSPAEFVEATVARLPAEHPLPNELRTALRCLA